MAISNKNNVNSTGVGIGHTFENPQKRVCFNISHKHDSHIVHVPDRDSVWKWIWE